MLLQGFYYSDTPTLPSGIIILSTLASVHLLYLINFPSHNEPMYVFMLTHSHVLFFVVLDESFSMESAILLFLMLFCVYTTIINGMLTVSH